MFAIIARVVCGLAMLMGLVSEHSAPNAVVTEARPAGQTAVAPDAAVTAALQGAAYSSHGAPDLRRVYRVTAYCDRGVTAAGVPSGVGQCAAPADIPFGSQIYIPELDRTFVVTDRTAKRFRHNTVDLFIPDRSDCREFGRRYIECEVTLPDQPPRYGSPRLLSAIAEVQLDS